MKAIEDCLCSHEILCSIIFLSMFCISWLPVIWVLCVLFINKSLYKSHRDFSKDKPGLPNIIHSRLNFNKFHKTLPNIVLRLLYFQCYFFPCLPFLLVSFVDILVSSFYPPEILSTLLLFCGDNNVIHYYD